MIENNSIEHLRKLLDRFIDTSGFTDTQIVQIIEAESLKGNSYLSVATTFERGAT